MTAEHQPWIAKTLLSQEGDFDYENLSDTKLLNLISKKSYTKERLEYLLHVLPNGDETMEYSDLTSISRVWGARIDKMKLCSSSNVNSYISHMIGTITTALILKEDGHNIHLIESVDSTGERVYKDVDILTTKNTKYYTIDYTNMNGSTYDYSTGILAYNHGDKQENNNIGKKYKILEDFTDVDHKSLVLSLSTKPVLDLTLKAQSIDDGPYKDSFTKSAKLVEITKSFNKRDVDDLLAICTERLSHHELEEGMIRDYPPLNDIYDADRIRSSLKENTVENMRYLIEVMTHISFLDKETQDLYSVDFFDRLDEGKMKPTTYFPMLTTRKIDTRNLSMNERSIMLRDHLISKNKKVPPLTMALSLCCDFGEHPTNKEREQWSTYVTDIRWRYFTLRKSRGVVYKGKETQTQGNFVELHVFGPYKTGEDFITGKGSGPGSIITRQENHNLRSTSFTKDQYEAALDSTSVEMCCRKEPGAYLQTMHSLVNDSLLEGDVPDKMRLSARQALLKMGGSGTVHWSEGYQMFCEAMSMMKKKSRHYNTCNNNLKSQTITLFCDEIGDRNGLIFSSTAYVSDKADDCYVEIDGDFDTIDPFGLIIGKHHSNRTRFFNLNRSDLDWGITAYTKVLTYFTLLHDTYVSAKPNEYSSDNMAKDMTLGLGLMIANNTRFTQISGQIRHLFNNSAGISNGTMDLYTKMDWYKPSSFTERLYCMRMIKITTLMQMLKANEDMVCAMDAVSSMLYTEDGQVGVSKMSWTIAMPSSSHSLPTDQSLYSSFYTSYAFANNRYNLTFMQSQVFLKQIASRETFVKYRTKPRPTDMENIPDMNTKEEVLAFMKENLMMEYGGGQHKPCHVTVMVGAMSTLSELHEMDAEQTIGDIVDQHYASVNKVNDITISSAANNRASVNSRGRGGVVPPKKIKRTIYKDKKKMVVPSVETQTSKNYETLFIDVVNFMDDTPGPKHEELGFKVLDSEYLSKPELTAAKLKKLLKAPNVVWPTLIYGLQHDLAVIARMIHKDDQKPREIAVMNMFLRLIALTIEEAARSIKNVEHKCGDYTNLIEESNKDKYAVATHLLYRGKKLDGKDIMNDNEDKSGWGPSQDPVCLSICLQYRLSDKFASGLYNNLFQAYTRKVFKAPDHLVLKAEKKNRKNISTNSKSVSNKSMLYMQESHDDVYDFERKCIYACEGMFQGTLSVMSSCLAADCMRLSITIATLTMTEYNYDSKGHVTSDDSARCMSYCLQGKSHRFIVGISLKIHNEVSKNYSFKRNMSCSVHTPYVFELNSIFHTADGRIVPALKSRLSYVTYSHELDRYQSAVSVVTRAAEYLRMESSVMGAYWVSLLNTFNHIRQFQLTSLYSRMGKKIFEVPLELGGLPRIDPLMSVSACPLSNIVSNYSGDFKQALSILTDTSLLPEEIEIDITDQERDELKLRADIPRMSRGSTTNLMMRECKDKRVIRETVMDLPKSAFKNLSFPGQSPLKALITCFSREGVYFSESSIAVRYTSPQVPYTAKVFYVSSKFLSPLFKEKRVSRKDMDDLVMNFEYVKGLVLTNNFVEEIPDSYPEIADKMQIQHDEYVLEMSMFNVEQVVAKMKGSHYSKITDQFVDYSDIIEEGHLFRKKHLPKELGGSTELHPVTYYEVESAYSAKLRKFMLRVQNLKFHVSEKDKNKSVAFKMLTTDFIEGSGLILGGETEAYRPKARLTYDHYLTYLNGMKTHEPESNDSPLSFEMCIIKKYYRKKINITQLVSTSTGQSTAWDTGYGSSQVLQSVIDVCDPPGIRCLNGIMNFYTKKPRFPLQSVTFSYGDIYVQQRPEVVLGSSVTSETIVKDRGRYYHYFTIWQGSFTPPNDSLNDVHEVLDLSGTDFTKVRLESKFGIICMTFGKHVIMAVDKDQHSMGKKVLISHNSPFLITRKCVIDHFLTADENVDHMLYEMSVLRSGVDTCVEETTENPLDAVEQDIVHFNDDESLVADVDFDDLFDDGSSDYSLLSLESESSESSDQSVEMISYVGSVDDPSISRAVIQRLVFECGLTGVPISSMNKARERRRTIRAYGWKFTVPIGLIVPGHLLDVDDGCIGNVLNIAKESYGGETIEYLWFKYYILESVLAFPGMRELMINFRLEHRNAMNESEDEDDEFLDDMEL